jgi:hypothetical protein
MLIHNLIIRLVMPLMKRQESTVSGMSLSTCAGLNEGTSVYTFYVSSGCVRRKERVVHLPSTFVHPPAVVTY